MTHSTTTIERFCQRAVLLHQGHVHGVGPSNVIVDQYHALLYADEKAYLQWLNRETAAVPEAAPGPAAAPETQEAEEEVPRARAHIVSCTVTDEEGAVQEVNGLQVVFVTKDNTHLTVRAIKTGEHAQGMVHVLQGLLPTDHVVVDGAFMVKGELLKGSVGEG